MMLLRAISERLFGRRPALHGWTKDAAAAAFTEVCDHFDAFFPEMAKRFGYRVDTLQWWVTEDWDDEDDDLATFGLWLTVDDHPFRPFVVMIAHYELDRFDDPVQAIDHLLYFVRPVLNYALDHTDHFGFPCHAECRACRRGA